MTDIDKLREEELNQLSQENEEIIDLENLIVDGANARFPVKIQYPKQKEDGTFELVTGGALLKPLTNVEWNNATRLKRSPNDKTTNEVELLKRALYTRNGEQFPPELVSQLPNGVVIELVKELSRISGVDFDGNMKLAKDMMGF